MNDRRPFQIVVIAVLFLVYASLRWNGIDDACLWFDEIFSVHAAEQPWDRILDFVIADLVHPPLFYILLKLWIGIGGSDLLWVRLLPFVFSLIAVIPFLLLARELKLKFHTIAFALFLVSVSGILINYTQRVRMYTLLMALTLMSIWLFVRWIRTGKGIVPLVIVNIFVIYTQYFGAFVIGCEVLAILILYREKWRSAIAIALVPFAAFVPWVIAIINAARTGSDPQQNIGWITRPGIVEVWTFVIDLVEPIYFQFSSDEPRSVYFISIPLLLIAIAVAIVFAVRYGRDATAEQNHYSDGSVLNSATDRTFLLVAIFAIAPIIIAFAVSWLLPYSVWGARHLIVCAGPLVLFAAMILERTRSPKFEYGVIAAVVLISAAAFIYSISQPRSAYLWCHWDEIGRELAAATPDGERTKVYTFESIVAYHLWFASRDSQKIDAWDITDLEPTPEDETYFLPRKFDGVKKGTVADIDGDRVRLIFRTHKPGEETIVFETLKDRGYSKCDSTPAVYKRTTMFVVDLVKDGVPCRN